VTEEHEHAVNADGSVHHLSVSQIQAFDRCKRLWYFDKVLHLPGKEFKGQTIGKEGHARLEAFFKSQGATDVLGPLERLGLERGCVPRPSALHIAEHHIGERVHTVLGGDGVALDAGGVPVEGYIDLVDLNGLLTEYTVRLIDWKFKKSIEKYGIRETDVFDPSNEAGIQLIGYAEWARRQFPTARFIEAGHVTFQTQGARDVSKVSARISVDLLPKLWDTVCRNVGALKETAREKDWAKVPPTFAACPKYGGCAYITKCHDPLARLTAALAACRPDASNAVQLTKEGRPMGLLSAAIPAAPAPAPVLAAVTPPDEPAPTIVSTPGSKVIVEDHTSDTTPVVTPAVAPGVSGVVPVASPKKRGRPPKIKVMQPTQDKGGESSQPVPGVAASFTPPAPAVATEVASSDTTGGGQSQTQGSPLTTETAGGDAPEEEGNAVPGSGSSSYTLYFNCAPVNTLTKSLLDFTVKVEKDFMSKAQVNFIDLRAATGNDLGFGKWKPYLAAAAAGRVSELPRGDYVVVETDERVQTVAEALAALPGVKSVRPLGGR